MQPKTIISDSFEFGGIRVFVSAMAKDSYLAPNSRQHIRRGNKYTMRSEREIGKRGI
jgi:hypothetical protein